MTKLTCKIDMMDRKRNESVKTKMKTRGCSLKWKQDGPWNKMLINWRPGNTKEAEEDPRAAGRWMNGWMDLDGWTK